MEAAAVAAVVGEVAQRLDAEEDYEGQEGITEESVAEVMSWLELEIKLAAGAAALPLPLPLPPPPAAALGQESCGPSLSWPASTVMASVDDWRAVAPPLPPAAPWPWLWPWPFPEPVAGMEEEADEDDDWVLQLLTDGPAVEGQHDGH